MTCDRSRPATRPLTLLALLYGGLLLYASLMPYDFNTAQDLPYQFYQAFNHWPFNLRARISGSDTLSNLVLYIPLGFLLAARLRVGRRSRPVSYWCGTATCTALSLGVETLQLVSISRVASASDMLLNSVSGIIGAGAGAAWGDHLWYAATAWLRERWRRRPLDILTLTIMILLAADAMAPFLPTIELSEVWHSLKRSHFNLASGFATHPWHWWLVTRVCVYLVLTALLTAWNLQPATDTDNGSGPEDGSSPKNAGVEEMVSKPIRQNQPEPWRHNLRQAMILTAVFTLGLEGVKPLIASRAINIANVAASFAGIGLAAVLGPSLAAHLTPRRTLPAGIILLTGYLLYLAWTPFDFTWDLARAARRLPATPVELLPFYHYAMGARLEHIRLFVQSTALIAILVVLLRVRFPRMFTEHPPDSRTSRLIIAIAIGASLGLLQEGGQLVLATRVPTATDIYCFMIGGALGAWLPLEPTDRHD